MSFYAHVIMSAWITIWNIGLDPEVFKSFWNACVGFLGLAVAGGFVAFHLQGIFLA